MIAFLIRDAWPIFWITLGAIAFIGLLVLTGAAIDTTDRRGSYEGWHRAGGNQTDRWEPDPGMGPGHVRPIRADADTGPQHERSDYAPRHRTTDRSAPGPIDIDVAPIAVLPGSADDLRLPAASDPAGGLPGDQAGHSDGVQHADEAAPVLALPDLPAPAPALELPTTSESAPELYRFVTSLSDTDVWPAIRFELGRLRAASFEPFWLPSW